MNSGREMLSSLLSTAQMGQTGIRSVLETPMRPALRKALENQLQEYDAIESEVYHLASLRGWELRPLDPAVKFLSDMMTRGKLFWDNTDSKIAGLMIQGNTRGMITGLKNAHQFQKDDEQIGMLTRKLLDCETANIRQMQSFL